MPQGKHIKIIIASDGTCRVDALHFTGPACKLATTELTVALGGEITHQHDKPELHVRQRCGQIEKEQAR